MEAMYKILAIAITIAIVTIFAAPAVAAELEGNYLYKVTTLRAAPGTLSDLLDRIKDLNKPKPFVMRHSQGDQWDLLIIAPMDSWDKYYETTAIERRKDAAHSFAELISEHASFIAFAEDHFAYGPSLATIEKAFDENNFFHIEMFKAAPGQSAALLQQRRMENTYLAATGQTANMIFHRAAGSDIDVFTIGFHPSLQVFAQPADVTNEEKDVAAKSAGFKGLSDISFYLRSLITGHHDTLAVKVD